CSLKLFAVLIVDIHILPNSIHLPYTTLFRSWSLRIRGLRPRSIPRIRRHPDGAHASYSFQAACARRSRSAPAAPQRGRADGRDGDRKSTRLNSSHVKISYAVFCLKKKT